MPNQVENTFRPDRISLTWKSFEWKRTNEKPIYRLDHFPYAIDMFCSSISPSFFVLLADPFRPLWSYKCFCSIHMHWFSGIFTWCHCAFIKVDNKFRYSVFSFNSLPRFFSIFKNHFLFLLKKRKTRKKQCTSFICFCRDSSWNPAVDGFLLLLFVVNRPKMISCRLPQLAIDELKVQRKID